MREDLLKTMAPLWVPGFVIRDIYFPIDLKKIFSGDITIEKVTAEIKGVFPLEECNCLSAKVIHRPHSRNSNGSSQSNCRGLTQLGRDTLGPANPPVKS